MTEQNTPLTRQQRLALLAETHHQWTVRNQPVEMASDDLDAVETEDTDNESGIGEEVPLDILASTDVDDEFLIAARRILES